MDSIVTYQSPPPRNLCLQVWTPPLIWVAVILVASSSVGSSEHTADLVRWILTAISPDISAAKLVMANHLMRKCGHFTGYGLLSVLFLRSWWLALCLRHQPRGMNVPGWCRLLPAWRANAALLALLSTAVIASLDEWQQTFHASRTGTWRDVALDCMAAGFAQTVVLLCSDLRVRARPSTDHQAPESVTENHR